ncbi:MAG: hypothetical protein FWG51_04565 [Firmicutes bacterium]|nr:hypothetical protein [Bacillota bacterium]
MKGVKLAAAIIAIVEGAAAAICGILMAVFAALSVDFFETFLDDISDGWLLDWLSTFKTVFIVIGIVVAVLGLIYLIFGIKFCRDNSKKGTAITLLVFSILLGCIPVVVLTIVYLVLHGQQNQNYQSDQNYQPDQNYEP